MLQKNRSVTMTDKPLIQLDHINIPASKPEWLAEWYAEKFGFTAHKGFVSGAGTLIIFEEGEPLNYKSGVQFGFRCNSLEQIQKWAQQFKAPLVADEKYSGFEMKDPEGNCFEIYWED
jgi:catechol-2,3-dioxygenase